jgi:hypothetical protein
MVYTEDNKRESIYPEPWPGVARPANWFLPAAERAGYTPTAAGQIVSPPSERQPINGVAPAGSGPAGHGRRSRRITSRIALCLGVPLLVAVLVSVGTLVMLRARADSTGTALANQRAGNATSVTPGSPQGAAAQVFSQVAVSGDTVVAVPAQGGPNPQFLVSADGGRSMRPGLLRSSAGPVAGHEATLVAGGPGGWAALGPRAIWTSPDGRIWTLTSAKGLLASGDALTALVRTSAGFLATGTNASAGTGLVWTSPDGATWHRFTAAQFGLVRTPGEQVFSMTGATSSGNDTLIVGNAHSGGKVCSYVWLSSDSGASWRTVIVPMGRGAHATFSGMAGSAGRFIAVRPGATPDGRPDALVYTSRDAVNWKFASVVPAPGGFTPTEAGGGPGRAGGFVIAGRDSRGNLVAYTSTDNGATWTLSVGFGQVPAGESAGVTMLPDGAVLI